MKRPLITYQRSGTPKRLHIDIFKLHTAAHIEVVYGNVTLQDERIRFVRRLM